MRSFKRCRALAAAALLHAGHIVSAAAAADTRAEFGPWGVETHYIAADIAPGDDFYRYVNKGWLDTARIPAGFPMTGAFIDLTLRTERQVQAIIDDVKAQGAAPGTPAQQIADMHASYMDTARRNALGSSMLLPELADILKAADRREIARRMGSIGYTSIVDAGVLQDSDRPDRYALTLGQGGLGLPGRDYYLKKGEPYAGFRAAYTGYIEGVFARAGVPDGKARATAILAFETALARAHWTPAMERDAVRNHHPMSVRTLQRHAPGLDWPALLGAAGFGDVRQVDVRNDSAIRAIAALFARTPIDSLRAYTAFHYLDNQAPLLSDDWVDAHFDFYSRRLAGISEQRPLDKRALDFLNRTLGEPLGRLYAERHFSQDARAGIDRLVKCLRQAFRERLARVDWMDPRSRAAAVAKLDAIATKIGAPEQWHDYGTMRITRDDLVGNVREYERWMQQDARARLDEPVRKWEWDPAVMPQVINAYFNPNGAEVVLPAAILQAPFFDPAADPAVNFGAIGTVIGHELGHGFDDQGSRYDGTGALRNWWGARSRRNFERRTARLVAQYNRYSPLPGLNVNGQLTLGENIGDLGGMMVAWSGYRTFVATEYRGEAPVIDSFSGNQRFFLGYAQLWRSLTTEAFLRQTMLTDPHSPDEFRVNGVLRNFGPWYDTFHISPANALYLAPEERVSIW